jgi:hypothetical protein
VIFQTDKFVADAHYVTFGINYNSFVSSNTGAFVNYYKINRLEYFWVKLLDAKTNMEK